MAKNNRGWTAKQKEDFVEWHEGRLKELNYPPEVAEEFRNQRDRWMPATVEAAE